MFFGTNCAGAPNHKTMYLSVKYKKFDFEMFDMISFLILVWFVLYLDKFYAIIFDFW